MADILFPHRSLFKNGHIGKISHLKWDFYFRSSKHENAKDAWFSPARFVYFDCEVRLLSKNDWMEQQAPKYTGTIYTDYYMYRAQIILFCFLFSYASLSFLSWRCCCWWFALSVFKRRLPEYWLAERRQTKFNEAWIKSCTHTHAHKRNDGRSLSPPFILPLLKNERSTI